MAMAVGAILRIIGPTTTNLKQWTDRRTDATTTAEDKGDGGGGGGWADDDDDDAEIDRGRGEEETIFPLFLQPT